jgi:hypothetical protein
VVLTARFENINSVAVPELRIDSRVSCCRIYAVAKKNIPIAIGFALITASQLALGIYFVVVSAKKGGKTWTLGSTKPFSF